MSTSIIPSGMHTCAYCGPNVFHAGVCPRVKSIEYHQNGTVAKVELHPPAALYATQQACPTCGGTGPDTAADTAALIASCSECGAELRADGEPWLHEPDCSQTRLWQQRVSPSHEEAT